MSCNGFCINLPVNVYHEVQCFMCHVADYCYGFYYYYYTTTTDCVYESRMHCKMLIVSWQCDIPHWARWVQHWVDFNAHTMYLQILWHCLWHCGICNLKLYAIHSGKPLWQCSPFVKYGWNWKYCMHTAKWIIRWPTFSFQIKRFSIWTKYSVCTQRA